MPKHNPHTFFETSHNQPTITKGASYASNRL